MTRDRLDGNAAYSVQEVTPHDIAPMRLSGDGKRCSSRRRNTTAGLPHACHKKLNEQFCPSFIWPLFGDLYSIVDPCYLRAQIKEMLLRVNQILLMIGIVAQAGGLAGCGTVNERLAAGVSDAIPAWAGGLPADAPPRPGTARYDEYMKERERRRLLPASERDALPKSDEAGPEQARQEIR